MTGATTRVAAAAAKAVLYCSLTTLGVWLLWYGRYQWAGYDCKVFRRAVPGGSPAAWVTSTPCALKWNRPLLPANLGFLYLTPAVAALAALAVVALREHKPASSASATLQCWGSTLLPPKRLWLWWCGGLTLKDALLVVFWATYNAVWYAAIIEKPLAAAAAGAHLSPRTFAKSFASLMMPNLVPLLFPVSRGSVISNALGLSFPDGIRYHRWLGQWVLLLISLHGLIYWLSWAADGRWVASALRHGADTNNLLGGVALMFALLLWATSQEPVRRRFYSVYKTLHHLGFWGFMLMGVAHHWALFWYFVPGMLLYVVDGVFRLHQMFAGRGGDLAAPGAGIEPGMSGVNSEVLQVDVDPARTMCSLLLASPEFGAAPAGVVWLNVPTLSLTQWHPFDYTASEVVVGSDGCVTSGGKGAPEGQRRVTALSVHIKAYSRWTRALVNRLSSKGGQQKLTIRIQGPYADPPASISQPDGVILVAGGNGIASALPVFEELSAAGVSTQGLPALLLWPCRKGHEFEHMAAPVMAAARALGLNLTVRLHITDGVDTTRLTTAKAAAGMATVTSLDTATVKDRTNTCPTLAIASTRSCDTDAAVSEGVGGSRAASVAASVDDSSSGGSAAAGPTSLCPVVAFASFAAQLSFRAVLHLAVFGGFLAGLAVTIHVGHTMPMAAGRMPWETLRLGPALVLIPAGFAVGLGLITLWVGLALQRKQRDSNPCLAVSRGPAWAIATAAGKLSQLLPGELSVKGAGKGGAVGAPASLLLQVPVLAGSPDTLPVVVGRPSVADVMQGWLSTLQQLPAAAPKGGSGGEGAGSQRLHCLVYGCGPELLDQATRLAVAAISGKQNRRGRQGGSRPVQLQFVRKAQML